MTREEAIDEIKWILETTPKEPPIECDYVDEWLDNHDKMIKALNTAIKALEQEPCEDAVSRKALINAFPISDTYTLDDIIATIKFQPSVTPTRPKGYWIDTDETHSECDQCGAVFEIVSANGEANYCPNCGCLMSYE